jgi:predicted transcriptional regulator
MPKPLVPKGPILNLRANDPDAQRVLKALASEPRCRILDLLSDQLLNVSEIAEALGLPLSTANLHITTLEDAGLLLTELKPASRGLQKVCARAYDTILIQLPRSSSLNQNTIEIPMPVGAYVDCQITPTCGLASEEGIIGLFDDPASFYEADRVKAQLLWFHKGYVEYRFPNRLPPQAVPDSLHLSLELCSEAPLHHDDWPSDITVWINEVEIGTWTCPADFGGQRGVLTPDWWENWNSQYGLLKVWQVNGEASYVDGLKISPVVPRDLDLVGRSFISVRIGVKPDARHVGGINIFGRHFGNYPQDIVLSFRYH